MEKKDRIKKRVFDIIQVGNKTDFASTAFDMIISLLIIISICVTFLQTFDNLAFLRPFLGTVEFFTIAIFTVEYILRIWTAGYLYPDIQYSKAIAKYMVSFYGIVDLLTIVSYFVPFLFTNGFVALRMLRVVRIMRLFKLNATYDAFNVITDVLKDKKDQIISSVFMVVVLMLASSMCMYSLEHDAQPENFKNAFSGIWWSVSTLLTVGYGDIYPVTIGGKLIAIFISFLGVGMVAIPTGIISAGFVEYYSRIKSGTHSERDVEFVVMNVTEHHSFINHSISDIRLPEGLYIAVVLRGEDILTPYGGLTIQEGDNLLLASTSSINLDSCMEEVTLERNHPWINMKLKKLDISRQTFIVMIRRGSIKMKPEGDTVLREGDVIVLFG